MPVQNVTNQKKRFFNWDMTGTQLGHEIEKKVRSTLTTIFDSWKDK